MLNKPKKSLGQNFLHDRNIISKIIDASKIEQEMKWKASTSFKKGIEKTLDFYLKK